MTDDPRIDPADLRSAKFPGSFRKYDAAAVMAFLDSVADRVEATNALVDDLQRQVADAKLVRRLAPAEPAVAAPAPEPARPPSALDAPDLSALSDDEIVRLLGEETASVLSTARRASEEIRSKAESNAERLIRESTAEAQRLVEEAEAQAATLTTEAAEAHESALATAAAAAAELTERATEDAEARMAAAVEATEREQARADAIRIEADEVVARARVDADAMVADERARADVVKAEAEVEAAAIIEHARAEGRSMVQEAKDVRARVLEDLVRRRDAGRGQVERLLEGRDRLLEAYGKIRDDIDQMTDSLASALDDPNPDPALEAGFVGIITSVAAEEAADDVEVDADDVDPDPDDRAAAEPIDATADDGPDAESRPGSDDDDGPDEEVTETAESEPADDPDAGDQGEESAATEGPDGVSGETPGAADELFARIRSERAESVARARQVLADGADAAEADPDQDDEQPGPVAGDSPQDVAEIGPDAADESTEVASEPAGAGDGEDTDVDRLPAELLASGRTYDHRRETLDELDKVLSRLLKRHLAHEQNEVLDTLRTTETSDVSALLPDEADHIAGYALVAMGPLRDAASAAASLIDEDAPIDIVDLAETLASNLVSPFRRRIEASVSEVGDDPDALDERLRALYREWKVERIGTAATDGLFSAYAEGQLAAAPEGAPVRWLIDPGQGPCPDAQDNALAGAISAGEAFPTGDACPQAHPGCRCLLAVDN